MYVQMSKIGTPLWRKAPLEASDVDKFNAAVVKSTFGRHKTRQVRSTLCCSPVEKLHAAVARSTFASEHVQNTCVLTLFVLQMSKNQSVSKFVSQSISQVVN